MAFRFNQTGPSGHIERTHMTTSTIRLNDVNIEAVGALAQAIQAEPAKGDTTWKASVKWDGGFRTTTKIREFAAFGTDEPEALGGTDAAPNPVEQLIGALGSCLAIGYAADPATLPEELCERDSSPRNRHPLARFVFTGRWDDPAPLLGD